MAEEKKPKKDEKKEWTQPLNHWDPKYSLLLIGVTEILIAIGYAFVALMPAFGISGLPGMVKDTKYLPIILVIHGLVAMGLVFKAMVHPAKAFALLNGIVVCVALPALFIMLMSGHIHGWPFKHVLIACLIILVDTVSGFLSWQLAYDLTHPKPYANQDIALSDTNKLV